MKSHRVRTDRLAARWSRLLLVLGLLAAATAESQPLRPVFDPVPVWNLTVDGQASDTCEVFYSRAMGAFLVLAPEFDAPVLLSARTREVATLQALKLVPQSDGTYQLLPNAVDRTLGSFQLVGGDVVRFNVDGKSAALKKRPWLLGPQTATHIRAMNVQYDRDARAYKPDPDAVSKLKAERGDIRVVIYFGEWCPHCAKIVPTVLGLQDAVGKSDIQFVYYGLPEAMSDDPIVDKLKLEGVPTGIVYRGQQAIGRIYGRPWEHPGRAILNVLGQG